MNHGGTILVAILFICIFMWARYGNRHRPQIDNYQDFIKGKIEEGWKDSGAVTREQKDAVLCDVLHLTYHTLHKVKAPDPLLVFDAMDEIVEDMAFDME